MRRWNGWGDDENNYPLPAGGEAFLKERIGATKRLKDARLKDVVAAVGKSRLPDHPLIDKDPELRVRHARGQSLPDMLATRSGEIGAVPDGVAQPESAEEVAELLKFAAREKFHVIPYGGGTSVAGHINPEEGDTPVLTVSVARMNQLTDLDPESQIATFGAGTAGPDLEAQLRARGYTLGHFPQSFELSTVGGWVASRSSGQQSLRYGRIEALFAGGRMETPVGTLEIPTFPASSAGPDVREMVMGSEGRMGIITEVKVRVTPLPARESFHVAFLPDWESARACVQAAAQAKIQLSMMRLSNAVETETQLKLAGHESMIALLETYLGARGARKGKCMMTFGLTGSKSQCKAAMRQMRKLMSQYDAVYTGTKLGAKWAENRFRAPYLRESLWEVGYAVDTLETATDWVNVDTLLDSIEHTLREGLREEGEKVHVFTHLSHVYPQGSSIYTTYVFRTAKTYAETYDRWLKLKTAASQAIVDGHGTISHQHGVGVDHAPYLPAEKGTLGMKAIRGLAKLFDPKGVMNPGKLFLPGRR